MAPVNVDAWIPEEKDGTVITRVRQTSAVEALARRVPMSTLTRTVNRSGAIDSEIVQKSGTYNEDASTNDEVTLVARKFGKALRVAEEDEDDATTSAIDTKREDWATAYAKHLDNACLGTTAASNGTTVPFTSVYRAIVSDSLAAYGYTAGDNHVTFATAVDPDYSGLSAAVNLYESGDWFDLGNSAVIASPGWRHLLRDVVDSQGRPIFVESRSGGETPDTLFGMPITWSHGAVASATATSSPTGNDLLIVCNRQYLMLGVRSGPEARAAGPDAAFLTDEMLVKMRSRRGFAVGMPGAFVVIENVP